MRYSKFSLSSPDLTTLQSVIRYCPYGILHLRCQQTGNKVAVLVKLNYSDKTGLTCKVAHCDKEMVSEMCNEPVSLKLCNKEMNIYVVASVTVSPDSTAKVLSKEGFRMAVQRFNFFRKNKFQQLIAHNPA
ncbi:MAG: hypothetical protein EOO04_00945 [Chitinophagaceae bacterium]|nr:MAG: hypothetical protein EOO04_00945 [Chitinophagaceae bacterium]